MPSPVLAQEKNRIPGFRWPTHGRDYAAIPLNRNPAKGGSTTCLAIAPTCLSWVLSVMGKKSTLGLKWSSRCFRRSPNSK